MPPQEMFSHNDNARRIFKNPPYLSKKCSGITFQDSLLWSFIKNLEIQASLSDLLPDIMNSFNFLQFNLEIIIVIFLYVI